MTDWPIIPCPNPDCPNYMNEKVRCWDHCNHCGAPIIWKPPGMDWSVKYSGPKPLNPDGTKHAPCMTPHTKDGKYYSTPKRHAIQQKQQDERLYPRIPASVILCPVYFCTHASVLDLEMETVQRFEQHVKIVHPELKPDPELFDKLDSKVKFLRDLKSSFLDPFLFVSIEELTNEGQIPV